MGEEYKSSNKYSVKALCKAPEGVMRILREQNTNNPKKLIYDESSGVLRVSLRCVRLQLLRSTEKPRDVPSYTSP